MKRFPAGLASPALLVFLVPLAGCLPSPDVSGLPPFDASGDDVAVITLPDSAAADSTIPNEDSGPPADALADTADGALAPGTISGVVVDYSEANGKGVLPGATVSISVGSSTAAVPSPVTTDANGLFTISNVPAGIQLEVIVTKATDLVNEIAYSTSLTVATLAAGQTLDVFPVVHEGCYQTFALPGSGLDASANEPVTLQNAQCRGGTRTGAFAAITFEAASFADCGNAACSATAAPWNHAIRVEMIPLAYPSNAGTPDLSWSLGLPGQTTPAGLLGAVEYRVIGLDPGQADDGDQLDLSGSAQSGTAPVGIAVPVYTAPTGTPGAFAYDPVGATWSPQNSAAATLSAGADAGVSVQYQTMIVPHILPTTWWGVTNGAATTTCITGTLSGVTGESVLVRAAGTSYLGASTATTSAGTFCMDVATSSTVQIYAGAVIGGVPSALVDTGITVGSAGTGTCASGTGCSALGSLQLTPIVSCVSGDVFSPTDASIPSPLNVVEGFGGLSYAASAGIQSSAYVGQTTIGTGGAFCALGTPGGSIQLADPNSSNITSPAVAVPIGSNAPTCAAGGCADAGALSYALPP